MDKTGKVLYDYDNIHNHFNSRVWLLVLTAEKVSSEVSGSTALDSVKIHLIISIIRHIYLNNAGAEKGN